MRSSSHGSSKTIHKVNSKHEIIRRIILSGHSSDDILTKNISDIYAGYTKALIAPSVHGGLCFEVFQETNSTKLYGYVNAHAEIVVPIVFENVDWAKKTYKEYKDLEVVRESERLKDLVKNI